MKTTIELPNDLLLQAKAIALKRRTTLKSMIEHALRRELYEATPLPAASKIYAYNEYGFPILKRGVDRKPMITNDMISKIVDEADCIIVPEPTAPPAVEEPGK